MIRRYDEDNPTAVVLMPLNTQAESLMPPIFNAFTRMGVEASVDTRRIPIVEKFNSYERAGTDHYLVINNENIAQNRCKAGRVRGAGADSVPIRDGVNLILRAFGAGELPFDHVLPGDTLEAAPEVETARPATAPNGLPVTGWMSNRQAEVDEIPSWPVGDESWMDSFGTSRLSSIKLMEAEWRLVSKVFCPILWDDRIYLTSKDAANAHGADPKGLSKALKTGRTEYNEHSIGYAIPVLDAIRRGVTREEFEKQSGRTTLRADEAKRSEIQSWHIDDPDSWKNDIGATNLMTIRMMKAEWKLAGKVCVHIRCGYRIYRNATEAAEANGFNLNSFSYVLRSGKAKFKGKPIGYADPALDAIRRGLTREEFEEQRGKTALKGDIQTWDIDDKSWMDELGAKNRATIKRVKAEWKLAVQTMAPVFYGDRVYLQAKQAAKENGFSNAAFSRAMSMGRTEFNGKPVGYADPALDAIRRGISREEFAAEISGEPIEEPPAVDPGPANPQPRMGDLLEAAKKEANGAVGKKAVEEDEEPAGSSVVAVLVDNGDGTLSFDRDFDFETAQRVIEHCAKVAKKAARVSL